jgi:hypothetical protein
MHAMQIVDLFVKMLVKKLFNIDMQDGGLNIFDYVDSVQSISLLAVQFRGQASTAE